MLDIYYALPSTTAMPDDPGHLEFAGSIDLDAHRSLGALFEMGRQAGADLPYFQDTLLEPAQVTILLTIFTADARKLGGNREELAAFDLMRSLLEEAARRGVGLVAFGD